MHTPSPPDPMKTAQAQTQMNKDTAITQQELNQTDQVTPYGNLTYTQSGTNADGTPKWTATQTLSPENQALFDNYMKLGGTLGTIGNNQADAVSSTLSKPFDFDAATATKLSDIQKTFLDPQWQQQESSLQTNLLNRGITPGSEAYTRAMQDFSTQKQNAYNQAYLDSYNTAENAALTQRNQPLNELSALMSGSQVQQPGFTSTPTTSVSGVDYAGLVNNQYNQKVAQSNAAMGGLFGLGSAALGGWALGGLKNPFASAGGAAMAAASDIRVKENISRVGALFDGTPIYVFNYIGDNVPQIGVMAQDVETIRPDAVVEINGVKHVYYDRATERSRMMSEGA